MTFFSNIGPDLSSNMQPSTTKFSSYLGQTVENNFIFCRVTPELVLDISQKMKSKLSCGPDNISSKLLKSIIPIIIQPFYHLFNLSFQTGYIPQQFKTAKVVPVYKSGDEHNYTNYRPIGLLSSFPKLLEKVVAKQMAQF